MLMARAKSSRVKAGRRSRNPRSCQFRKTLGLTPMAAAACGKLNNLLEPMTLGYLSLRYMSMGIAPARARAYNPAMNAKNMLDLWDGSLCPALEEKIKSFNESNRLDKNREVKFRWDVPNAYLTLRYTLAEGAKLPNMTLTLDLSNCSIHAEYENVKNVKPVDLDRKS